MTLRDRFVIDRQHRQYNVAVTVLIFEGTVPEFQNVDSDEFFSTFCFKDGFVQLKYNNEHIRIIFTQKCQFSEMQRNSLVAVTSGCE